MSGPDPQSTGPRDPRSGEHAFEFSGGELCLDFANTVSDRPTPEPKERILGYADLVVWGRQAGVLAPKAAARLSRARRGAAVPGGALRDLFEARRRRGGRGRGPGDAERGPCPFAGACPGRTGRRGFPMGLVGRAGGAGPDAMAGGALGPGATDIGATSLGGRVRRGRLRLAVHRREPEPEPPLV